MNSNSRLMIAVVAALLIAGASGVLAQQPDGVPGGASVGQTAPNSWRGGQTAVDLTPDCRDRRAVRKAVGIRRGASPVT
jgi:hypothetical protein